jgi:hypothetical protein
MKTFFLKEQSAGNQRKENIASSAVMSFQGRCRRAERRFIPAEHRLAPHAAAVGAKGESL